MAIIYSYPEIGTIAAGDLMPITDVSDTQFPTKSVTLTKLATYFSAQSVAGLDPQQLVTFDGGGLTSLAAGTAGQYMLSQGTGVYPTWNDVPWISLSQYNLPYWNGSSFTNSIIKVQPNQNLPTIEVGESGDASTKMKIFGGLEIEPAQPDFTSDKQFIIKADNSGGSQQPKISVPSNFDRVGINTANPNAALVVGPGDQTDGKLLGIVKQTGLDYAYMYFSDSIGTGTQITNGIVYESNTVGTAPQQKGDRISFFTTSATNQGGNVHFEQGRKVNAIGNIPQNYVAIPNIEEFEQGNIPGPGFTAYSYMPQDGLYVDQGVVKIKRTGMETQTSIILASPNGTKYKVAVDDTGVLTTTAI